MSAAPLNRTVMWLTRRQLFAKQRLVVAIGLTLVPAMITLIYRFATDDPAADAVGFLSSMYRGIVLGVLLPITALVFGTSAFGGEVEDGTLIYLMVKPVPRWQLTFSKYVVALAATVAVVIPAILLAWVLTPGKTPIRVPLSYAAGSTVGSIIYCAIFVTLGITSRRALALGLLYIIAFENVLSRNIVGAKSLSVREFSLAVCKKVVGTAAEFTDFTVSMGTVWTMGTIFLAAALATAVFKLQRYEVAERL
jgi:ABC-2 type transport system permease protein